jgi:uncharacterized protein YfaS (alpha-2-macroglobulin family)
MRTSLFTAIAAGLLTCAALSPASLVLAQQAPPPFASPLVSKDADRLEAQIKAQAPALARSTRQTPSQLRQSAQRLLNEGKDARQAYLSLIQVVAAEARDPEAWLLLARAILAITPDQAKGEQYELPALASGAALRAYELSRSPAAKADALAVMVEGLRRRSLWRPALEALKTALALQETPELREAYEKMRAEHGFRMLDYKVDSNAAEPRLCLNFSERLAGTQADLAKFVTVDGRDPQNVTIDQRQLCIDGLAHGKRYEVKVRQGLPSEPGEPLQKTVEIAAYVRDRDPSVRFSGRAYVLPNRGQQGIPVVTINTERVTVEIYRIGDRGLAGAATGENFLKELQRYEIEAIRERSGQRVWKGELAVANRLNEEVTTALPVAEALPRLEPGVYVAAAALARRSGAESDDGDFRGLATQWFIVSDLGLTAMTGEDGVHAFVRSLGSADPVAGVTLRLVARNGEILAAARTDTNGYACFDAGLRRGEGGLAPALLVAETGQDYAFLDLAAAAFDLTDRGVKGREAPGPIDAYLYAERGVYRPGEPVNLTALVRDRGGLAAAIPVTLAVHRPDGVEHRRLSLPDQGLGGRTMRLDLAPTAMTGTWRAKLYADPKGEPIAQVSFLVEDFVPERLDLKLSAAAPAIAIEETARFAVDARYLYGPPAAGLDLEGEVIVKPATADLEGYPGYRFGRADEKIAAVRKALEDLPQTDASGKAEVVYRLPPVPRTSRPLEADVVVRLREPGGRAVERKVTLPVATGEPRIGLKPLFGDSAVGEGQAAEFDVVVLGPDGRAAARSLRWQLSRLETRWQWYRRDGQWNYEPVTTAQRVADGSLPVAADKPARIANKVDWGRYRLDVTSEDGGVAPTSVIFAAGWHQSESLDSPEMLDIALDKPRYKAGEVARLRIASKESGKAQVAVLSSGILAMTHVDVPAGGTEVALDVKESWLPGAYVAVTLYRSLDERARRMPSRAIGVKWLALDTSAQALKVSLDAPQKARPGAPLTVPLKVVGLAPGEEARVTVAAVDVGILNLTRFESPKPENWFLAQRRLGLEIRDFYGRLIDGMRAERGRLRSGGDGGGGMSMKGSPPVETPLSLFSGIVKVGADGTARVAFDMPDFNGTVRLMAVAWSGRRTGSGEADVVIRDQVAVTATGPRFLTLGDAGRLAVDIHNVEAGDATFTVSIDEERPGGERQRLPQRQITLKRGERRREQITLQPAALGRSVYDVRITGPGGIDVGRRLAFDVKPPAADIRRAVAATLAPKGGRLMLSKDLLADFIPGTARISISLGPIAALNVPLLLGQLDAYPYGCAEQTTSRALPLLYVNDMARRVGMAEVSGLRARVEAAIDRVLEMQNASGAFGVWGPAESGDLWLTAYVADFLTRAREAGYDVRPQPLMLALDRLQNYLSYAQDFEKGGEARAYALYVLARNGRAPIGDLRYYVDTRLDRFATALAQAQLGAALAMLGEKERAERAFKAAARRLEAAAAGGSADAARQDYGSTMRDGAAVLTLAAETGVAPAEVVGLAGVLARVYRTRQYTSTQEQAWMLLAARALVDAADATSLSVNGVAHKGQLIRALSPTDLEAGALTIENRGEAAVDGVVTVFGAALQPEPAAAKGFRIERSYYTLDGRKIDMKSAEGGTSSLKQNDRLVVVLKIEGEDAGGRVLLVDRLPAGLEIENPRLVDSGDLKSLDWLRRTHDPEHTEFRDDRFVAAFDFFGEGGQNGGTRPNAGPLKASATVAYMVRAVTPGTFVHPAATVEDMYRPERFARTASGRLEVTPADR